MNRARFSPVQSLLIPDCTAEAGNGALTTFTAVDDVVGAVDAAEVFVTLGHSVVDLVIVAWEMESLDGLDFVRLILPGSTAPILISQLLC